MKEYEVKLERTEANVLRGCAIFSRNEAKETRRSESCCRRGTSQFG